MLSFSGCDSSLDGIYGVKIAIDQEGIYRIDAESLLAEGMDIRGVKAQQLQLSLRGVPQSLFMYEREYIIWLEFFGQGSDSLYSSENIYLLELKEDAGEYSKLVNNIEQDSASTIANAQAIIIETIRVEENKLYFPQVEAPDHWFWASASNGQSLTFPIELPFLTHGDGNIRMSLWSDTDAIGNPDHHVILRINNQLILDERWDGKGEYLLEGFIPDGVLGVGENQVGIEIPGDTQAIAEVNWINWFELSYPRLTVANDDRLKFISQDQAYTFGGFNGEIHVYDVTEGDRVSLQLITHSDKNNFVFQSATGRTYYVIGEHGWLAPTSILPLQTSPDLRELDIAADYLAIGPEDFLVAAEELFVYRESQGLKVLRLPLQAIYDQFNHGFPEPEAINRFIIEATQKWGITPEYLLLIGDASYDPWNYLEQPITNILPSFFVQTQFGGQTASDLPFSDLDADMVPDIAVGRVPAGTVNEVQAFVKKTIAYEASGSQLVDELRILAIADGQEARFRMDAQSFLNIFNSYPSLELYAPEAGATDASSSIREYFIEGYSVVAYFGHGSLLMWGKDRLFTVDDATILSNTQYPILVNMTCLTGLFTHPKIESLSEVFLFNPSGGAVAILAPTSLTLPGEQSLLSTPFGEATRDGNYARLGDIFLYAQREIASDPSGVRDVLETFILLGDPGLVISKN